MKNRITTHPVLEDLTNKKEITFTYDGKEYTGYEGDTVASALLANGVRTLRVHEESGQPRAIYCNIGHCFECRVTINNADGVRACLTPIQDNMVVKSGKVEAAPLSPAIDPKDLPRTYADFKQQANDTKGEK
ncbi:MAG TPA: (2Fe-2S)-binding protein [Pseudogracilibacillus sp.]|nr:(2Fe-2S)-binding protein [Pseudogracilibacillus sp.]